MLAKFHLIIHIFLEIYFAGVQSRGLKGVRVNVPRYRIPGEMAQLQCDYDLGDDRLYSVKWYKDNEEFYKYIPKEWPKATKYDSVRGVTVNLTLSDSKKVVLNRVNFDSSGIYRCEVSAEAPSFSSAQSEARMDVVLLPNEDPIITDDGQKYQAGDVVRLNCTSGKSYPASVLDWYINEQQVKNDNALIRYETQKHEEGLESSVLGLQFVLDDRHFVGGSMRIKCVASVSPLLWRGDKESVVHSAPVENLREALLLVKSSGSSSTMSTLFWWTVAACCAVFFVT